MRELCIWNDTRHTSCHDNFSFYKKYFMTIIVDVKMNIFFGSWERWDFYEIMNFICFLNEKVILFYQKWDGKKVI